MPTRTAIPLADIRALAQQACLACGASPAMATSLVDASMSANLHAHPGIGFAHMLDYLDGLRAGRIVGQAMPVIEQTLPALITVDGADGIAQLGFDLAFDRLVAAAETCGIAIFAQRNTFTAGELGYYPRRLAARGLVTLAMANSHAMVATGPGRTVAYGTNPLAFGAPRLAGRPPLVIDQAVSATAFVNLARAASAGATIPEGWAIDDEGQPTTDPARAVLGALLPFGGAKGANIALMIEVISAGLTGAAWSLDAGHFRSGHRPVGSGLTVIAIAAAALDAGFTARLEAQLQRLAGLGVHIPGNAPPRSDGLVEVESETLAALRRHAGGS